MNKKIIIPHSMPDISDREINAVRRVLLGSHITQGPEVASFEKESAIKFNRKYAVAVNSGTSALHIALEALSARGGEVIIPSYTCTALLNAINMAGAKPKVVDVDRESDNIKPELVQKAINKKTRAVIVPHILGLPADIKEIIKTGIPVIEDCAMSIGAHIGNAPVGSFGDISIMSFYGTKMLGTGQGGMIFTSKKTILHKIKDLTEYDNRPQYKPRYNYKMTDIQAALGRVQLKRLESFINKRINIAKSYFNALKSFSVKLPASPQTGHVYFRFVVELSKNARSITQRKLLNKGIEAKPPIFRPIHRYLNLPAGQFKNTEEIYNRSISIPIYPKLSKEQQNKVTGELAKILKIS